MRVLVTGSEGHLGEALMRILPRHGHQPIGMDIKPGAFTDHVGSINDEAFVHGCLDGVDAIMHTATLHKPHVATHSRSDFVATNISGTLTLLEHAVAKGIDRFIYTSTTSAFGAALTPPPSSPAAWINESVGSVPRNIYGVTKAAAEDVCQLFALREKIKCIALRTSRFFPEKDDSKSIRDHFCDANAKANEFLFRRVDIEDAASAHVAALDHFGEIGFARFVISAPTPFGKADLPALRRNPGHVVSRYFPSYEQIYEDAGFEMFPDIERVYDSSRAQNEFGWTPHYDFERVLTQISSGDPIGSELSREIGIKGYHSKKFGDGPYPIE
jgi:UDP-glucose 4-epimerase